MSTFTFPLQLTSSVYFSSNAPLSRAVLSAGGTKLAVLINPLFADNKTELEFFGSKPFHGALAKAWQVKIELTLAADSQKTVPSLTFSPAEKTLTWDDTELACSRIHYEEVEVCGEAGTPTNKILVYMPERGGYKPGTKKVDSKAHALN